MKLKKLLLVTLLCSSVLALSACSTPGNKGDDDEAGLSDANSQGSGAQAAGLGDEDGFNSKNGQKGTLSQRTYYFDYDKSDVNEDDKPAILANANYLAAHQTKKVIVEGHTDPRGSREYNVALSERRSNAVAEILKSNGVNPKQLRQVGYGAERLAAPGHTEADYQKDRRAKIDY